MSRAETLPVDRNLFGRVSNRDRRKGPVQVGDQVVDLRTEADVARQVRAYLERRGFRLIVGDPGRGRLRSWNSGAPDVLTVLPGGRLLVVELKAPGAKPRNDQHAQVAMLDWLEHRGAIVIRRATSVDDVARALELACHG